MSNHHVRWSSFNGEHHYVDHIYYMIHIRPFGLQCSKAISDMLGSSSLTRVFCVWNTGLHSLYVNVELVTPDHHVVSQHETVATVHTQGEHLYLEILVRDHLIMLPPY